MNRRRQYGIIQKKKERNLLNELFIAIVHYELSWAINVRYFSHFIALKCQKFQAVF